MSHQIHHVSVILFHNQFMDIVSSFGVYDYTPCFKACLKALVS